MCRSESPCGSQELGDVPVRAECLDLRQLLDQDLSWRACTHLLLRFHDVVDCRERAGRRMMETALVEAVVVEAPICEAVLIEAPVAEAALRIRVEHASVKVRLNPEDTSIRVIGRRFVLA